MHNHFESDKDTANGNLADMILSFASIGRTKVPVTDHGVMTAFEDARDMLEHLRDKPYEYSETYNTYPYKDELKEQLNQMELIPGVEGYLALPNILQGEGEGAAMLSQSESTAQEEGKDFTGHILLIAKDYIGYQSLCHIVTQSGKDYVKGKKKGTGKPVITLDNLKANVKKGHIICTSACIAGIFGMRLGLSNNNLKQKLQNAVQKLSDCELDNTFIVPDELLSSPAFRKIRTSLMVEDINKEKLPLSEILSMPEETEAERLYKRFLITKANKAAMDLLSKEKAPKATKTHPLNPVTMTYYDARKTFYEQTGYVKKKVNTRSFHALYDLMKQCENLPDDSDNFKLNEALYHDIIDIFGEDDFYFELQYHGLEKERTIYNNLIDFARQMGNTNHFIISNDVHVGISKAFIGADNWNERLKTEVLKRHIIQFTRFNKFLDGPDIPDDDYIQQTYGLSPCHRLKIDDFDYYIKDDTELRDWVSRIVDDASILDNAFDNRNRILDECHVVFPKNENHYPAFTKDGKSAEDLFDEAITEGIKRRYGDAGLPPERKERLDYECHIIKSMGYAAYHLIVQDYLEYGRVVGQLPDSIIQSDKCPYTIEEARQMIKDLGIECNAYPIGPGRGSAGGSFACYLLGITDLDPIPYNLLFERFLNPERISMPKFTNSGIHCKPC